MNIFTLYWIDLIELVAALFFMIVFKIGLVWGMARVSTILSDDADSNTQKQKVSPKIPSFFSAYRYILSGLLIVNGLWQVRPALVGVSASSLTAFSTGPFAKVGLANGFTTYFAHHSVWMSIWSVVAQLALGSALLIFHQRFVTRIVSAITSILSLFVFVFAQNFGDLAQAHTSVLHGAPSAALLIFFVSVIAFIRYDAWQDGRMEKGLRFLTVGFWLLFTVLQWLPEDGYWSARGYESLSKTVTPGFASAARLNFIHALASSAVVSTIIFGLIGIALALWTSRIQFHSKRSTTIWFSCTILISLVVSWLSVGAGAGSLYIYALGVGAPVVAMSWLLMVAASASASKSHA